MRKKLLSILLVVGVVIGMLPAAGATDISATISTETLISNGATEASVVVISDVDFDSTNGAEVSNWTINVGDTGLTAPTSVTIDTNNAKQATLVFTGTAAVGSLEITAKKEAFEGVTADSNILTITVPAAGAAAVRTSSKIESGATNVKVVITSDKAFDETEAVKTDSYTISAGGTGLSLTGAALDETDTDNKTVELTFSGTVAEGTLSITVKKEAFATSESITVDCDAVTISVPADTGSDVKATVSSETTIANGATSVKVVITSDKAFDETEAAKTASYTISAGGTGLSLTGAALDENDTDNKTVELTFSGTAAEGTLSITVKKEAFATSESVTADCDVVEINIAGSITSTSSSPVSAVLSNSNKTLTVTLSAAPAADDTIKVYTAQTGGTATDTHTITEAATTQVIQLSEAASANVWVSYTSGSLDESARVESTGYATIASGTVTDHGNGAISANVSTTTAPTDGDLTISAKQEDADSSDSTSITKAEITMNNTLISNLAEAENVNTNIATDMGNITLPQLVMKAITENEKTEANPVVLKIEKKASTAGNDNIKAAFDVTVKANDEELGLSALSDVITFTFDLSGESYTSPILAYVKNGAVKRVRSSRYNPETGILTATTDHLTELVILDGVTESSIPAPVTIENPTLNTAAHTWSYTIEGEPDANTRLYVQSTTGSGSTASIAGLGASASETGTFTAPAQADQLRYWLVSGAEAPDFSGDGQTLGVTVWMSGLAQKN